ncbi:MAG: hypothetical protein KDI79_30660 [Anaerolineae bacterium]|nr:hypothetical protein [Anaerolineae bacterium]
MSKQSLIKPYQPEKVKVLFEGFGGTGKAYVLYLLVYLEMMLAGMKYNVRFGVSDIDTEHQDLLQEQFYNSGNIPPIHDLITEMKQRPEGFPAFEQVGDLDHLRKAAGPGNSIIHGANGYRPLGMLALLVQIWRRYPQLARFISRPLFELRAARTLIQQGFVPHTGNGHQPGTSNHGYGRLSRGPLLGIQTASIIGGFGSAQILMQAHLHHQIYQRQWGLKAYELRCNLLLPESFDHCDDQHKALAWATMLEIEAAYDVPLSTLELGSIALERATPPWVEVCLYGRMSAEEIGFNGREEILQVMAAADRMKHFGPMGEIWHGQYANKVNSPYKVSCSAAGVLELKNEIDAMLAKGGAQLAQQLVSDYLLRRYPEKKAEQLAKEEAELFFQQQDFKHLDRRFERDVRGRPIKPSLPALRGTKRKELPTLLANHDHKFFEAVKPALQKVAEKELTSFSEALSRELDQQINTHGLYQGLRWLEQVIRLVEEEDKHWQGKLRKLQTEIEQAKAQPSARLWDDHRERYRDAYQDQSVEPRLNEKKLNTTTSFLKETLNELVRKSQMSIGWIKGLDHVTEMIQVHQERLSVTRAQERPVCTINLLDYLKPGEEEQLITQEIEANWQRAIGGLRFASKNGRLVLLVEVEDTAFEGAQSLRTEEGLKRLFNYTQSLLDFKHVTVEAWLQKYDKPLEQWLADFEIYAAPLITIDETKAHRPAEIKLIGTEKGNSGYFSGANRDGWTVVETGNPYQVDVLITWHHLNWRWLSQSDSWERCYRRKSVEQPLHVWAEWHQQIETQHSPEAEVTKINQSQSEKQEVRNETR